MTGTTGGIIPIVIVPVVALASWLVMVYHAASHPRWGSQARADTVSAHALGGSVPAQRLSSPGRSFPANVQAPPRTKSPPRSKRGPAKPEDSSVPEDQSVTRAPAAPPAALAWDRRNTRATRRCHG